METEKDKIFSEIREILQKNRDAQKGFAKAAENAKDQTVKEYFLKKSADRKDFNERLFAEIQTGFPNMDIEGSFMGNLHRAWMDVKTLFAGEDDRSMLNEAIRGDKAAIEEYDDVLDYKTLPVGLSHLLNEQREIIKTDVRNKGSLEDLKDSVE
ncbi:ferritin-like domain-containing protein [Arenibacter certesii]|nr:PA2169 family four-helix-bundle protein [Arenibacter certesii]